MSSTLFASLSQRLLPLEADPDAKVPRAVPAAGRRIAAGSPKRAASDRKPVAISQGLCEEVPGSRWARVELWLDQYFGMTQRGTDLPTEIRAGTTAFLAAANNFVVNANIMKHAGVDPASSVVSGAFCAACACFLNGVLSNLPLGLVPSVGPNVFLAFSLVSAGVVGTDQALAISGACGLSLLVLSLTPVLEVVLGLVPLCIKYGLIMGTGLLSALIGLKSIGVVVPDTGPANDIVALGQVLDTHVGIAFVFLIIMASMLHNGMKGAVLLGMLGATVTDWAVNGDWPERFVALGSVKPHALDLGVLGDPQMWVQVGALLLMLLFSISGAVIGSGRMAGLLTEEGAVPGSTAVYVVCGAATMLSSALGTSPILVSMSASAGIREGGRTGLTSIVLGVWCLLTAFLFSPMAAAIPPCAVAPVLILVGVSMVGEAKEVAWWSMQEALPAFLCAVFQPFTYSVANGIYAGLGMSFVLFFSTGNFLAYMPGRRRQLELEKSSAQAHPAPVGHSRAHSKAAIVRSISRASTSSLLASAAADAEQGRRQKAKSAHFMLSKSRSSLALQQRFGFSERDLQAMQGSGAVSPPRHAAFSRRGREARLRALRLIEHAANLVGLDPEEIHQVVEERMLGGARNVEGHAIGGIAGWEAQLACGAAPGGADAPYIAAAARRLRCRASSFDELDEEALLQSQAEQMHRDIEAA